MDGHKFNGQRKGTHVEGEWEKRGERESVELEIRKALTIQKRVDPTKMCPLCSLH